MLKFLLINPGFAKPFLGKYGYRALLNPLARGNRECQLSWTVYRRDNMPHGLS